MDLKGNLFFDGAAGRLEALFKEPAGEVRRVAVVSHPHPLFGGTMHNKVVYRLARAFQDSGFATLRYNFRGVGRSEGTHDEGRGEQDDLRAAIQFLTDKYPDAELWLAGFSFGAVTTIRVGCVLDSAHAVVLAGLPVSKYVFDPHTSCKKPKLIVQGALDEFGTAADLEVFFTQLEEPKHLQIIENADHFFEGKLDDLYQAVHDFIASLPRNP
jgi:uncharacterized protein